MTKCSVCGKEIKYAYQFKKYKTKPSLYFCSRDCYIKWSKSVREKAICPLCGMEFLKSYRNRKYCFICSIIAHMVNHNKRYMAELLEIRKIAETGEGELKLRKRGYNRITIDIDEKEDLDKSLLVLRRLGFTDIKVETSPSGKGYHIVAWLKKGGLPKHKLLFIRKIAYDDTWRIYLDAIPGRQINVLFNKKKKVVYRNNEVVEYG